MRISIIRSGKVYNPARHEWSHKDTAVKDGRIMGGPPSGDCEMVGASGRIAIVELIDYRVHYLNHGTGNGVNPDAVSLPCGVTTIVDGGNYGATSHEMYRRGAISFSDVRILNTLLMGSGGQTTNQYPKHMERRYFDRGKICALLRTYPDNLVGLKLRLSADIIGENEAEKSLRVTVAVAEELGRNICVHVTDPVMDLEKSVRILRRNDVICYVYQGKGRETILDENGMVQKGVMDTRERGVLFDASNGCNNYGLEISRKAMKQGFIPDIISSDTNTVGFYLQPLHSLPRIMSKYLDMGMCLERVLDAVTVCPARLIGREELVSLDMGGTADVVIPKLVEKEVCYRDRKGHTLTRHQAIVPQMTIKGGKVMYCQADFTQTCLFPGSGIRQEITKEYQEIPYVKYN